MKGQSMNKLLIALASFFCALISCKNPLFEEYMEELNQVKNREKIMNYVSKNKDNLDQIEGLWTLGVIRTLYKQSRMVASETEPNRMRLAVIKEDDLFRIYNINGKPFNYIASFHKTDETGIYDYQCYFTETRDSVSATASLFDNLIIRYEYDAPKEIMMDYYYKSGPDKGLKVVKKMIENGNMRLSWKFSWIKYFPVESIESTKTYYLLFNYWAEDFPTIAKPIGGRFR
jgi:hypothetical protein